MTHMHTLIEQPIDRKKIKGIYLVFYSCSYSDQLWIFRENIYIFYLSLFGCYKLNNKFYDPAESKIIESAHLDCSFPHIDKCLRFKANNMSPVMFHSGKSFPLSIYHFMPESVRFDYSYTIT